MLWIANLLLANASGNVPETSVLNVVLQGGAFGLLVLIVISIFKHAPQLAKAHREGLDELANAHRETAKEAREQLEKVAAAIREDRHADRNQTNQQQLEFRLEARELRDAFEKNAAQQRLHDDQKTERLMEVINAQKDSMVDALKKIDESHRLLADAIRSKHPAT